MSSDRYDVLVVGAGFAGSTSALVAARGGLSTALFERGEFMGSKIVLGNLLYSIVVRELIPDMEEIAPLERFIRCRRFSCLTEESALTLEFCSQKYNQPPHNDLWTITRDKFDPWYAQQAVAAGADYFYKTAVTELIIKDSQVIGVKTNKGKSIYADITIIASGGNSKLVSQIGDHPEYPPDSYLLGIKELISLQPEIIQERFRLEDREGVCINFYGHAIDGNVGSGFLCTNYDTLAIGAVINARSLKGEVRNAPLRFLAQLKNHPHVKRMVKGGKTKALSTYIMPEIGFDYMRNLVSNGVMIVGDAAGFLNTNMYSFGTLMATLSGKYAAETALEAKKKGDYSIRTLSHYSNMIMQSYIMDDMRKYNRVPYFADNYPEFFKIYPELAVQIFEDYFTSDDGSPRVRQQRIFQKVKNELMSFPFLREIMESKRRFSDY